MMEDMETDRLFSSFIECIHEGVLTVDTGGNVTLCNSEASRLLGRKNREIIGSQISKVLPLNTIEGTRRSREDHPFECVISDLKTCKSNPRKTYRYIGHNDIAFPVSFTASPFIIDGVLKGVVILFRDISEEKRIDLLKSESIALTSHQLHTPLTAITWYIEMVQNELKQLPSDIQDFIEQISLSSKRMVKLVNSLLNVYRIERGELSINPTPVDIVTVVSETIEELSPQFEERKIKLETMLPQTLKASVEKQLVQIVIENLLTNAIKYSPEETTVKLKLSFTAHECQFEISDSGYGIPLDQQSHIFEKFFRADNVATQRGVGIGLYSVHTIVKTWGGHIWFQSKEDTGTTFFFTMPLKMRKVEKGNALYN